MLLDGIVDGKFAFIGQNLNAYGGDRLRHRGDAKERDRSASASPDRAANRRRILCADGAFTVADDSDGPRDLMLVHKALHAGSDRRQLHFVEVGTKYDRIQGETRKQMPSIRGTDRMRGSPYANGFFALAVNSKSRYMPPSGPSTTSTRAALATRRVVSGTKKGEGESEDVRADSGLRTNRKDRRTCRVHGVSGTIRLPGFPDEVTSRDFKIKDVFKPAPDPLWVIRNSPDGDKKSKALRALREPLQHGGTQQEQDVVVQVLV